MSVPSRYKGRPIEELISAGFYEPETHVVRAIKRYEFYVWSRDWQIEGVLRMLFHVLDPEVAKDRLNMYCVFARPNSDYGNRRLFCIFAD